MKKTLSVFLAIIMAVVCFPLNAFANDKLNGYTPISNKYDLMNIYKNPKGKYYLTSDIVFVPKDFNYGSDFLKYYESDSFNQSEFYGTFDGCGHTISGAEYALIAMYNYGTIINVKATDCSSQTGLFCGANLGKLRNCKIDSCNGYGFVVINCGKIEYCYSDNSSCGICVQNNETGEIENCINNSNINGNLYAADADVYAVAVTGGIVNNNYGKIYRCINKGNINSSYSVGGICGFAKSGTIEECINNGTLTTTGRYLGGICGDSESEYGHAVPQVINCLNTGTIKEGYMAFGIGEDAGPVCCVNLGNVINSKGENYAIDGGEYCYYLEGTGEKYCGIGSEVSLSATNIGKESSYKRFDFEKVWKIADGKPALRFADEKYIGLMVYDYPSKLVYNEGEAFNSNSLLVMSINNKGEWKFINDYTTSGYTGKKGVNTIKISSNKGSVSFDVIVYQNINKSVIKQKSTSMVATGKALTPGITVISPEGNLLTLGKDYKITYKNNTNPGKATLSISGMGYYNGTVNKTFNITPMKTSELKVKSKALKSLTLGWKKQSGVDGYIVQQYNKKTKEYKTVKTTTANSVKIGSLSTATQYKYRVRSYKKIDGKTFYGAFSDVLTATTQLPNVKGIKIKLTGSSKHEITTIKWKKAKGISGYELKLGDDYGNQIDWHHSKKVGKSKTKYVNHAVYGNYPKGYSVSCVKIRTYKKIGGKTVYGKWSKVYSLY